MPETSGVSACRLGGDLDRDFGSAGRASGHRPAAAGLLLAAALLVLAALTALATLLVLTALTGMLRVLVLWILAHRYTLQLPQP